jgi:hypothetical protein
MPQPGMPAAVVLEDGRRHYDGTAVDGEPRLPGGIS